MHTHTQTHTQVLTKWKKRTTSKKCNPHNIRGEMWQLIKNKIHTTQQGKTSSLTKAGKPHLSAASCFIFTPVAMCIPHAHQRKKQAKRLFYPIYLSQKYMEDLMCSRMPRYRVVFQEFWNRFLSSSFFMKLFKINSYVIFRFLYFLDYCCSYGGGDPRAQTQRRNKAKVLAGLARPSVALVQIILCWTNVKTHLIFL